MEISCANCKSTDYILSDCGKYIKCNICKEIHHSECIKCKSYKLKAIINKYGINIDKCMYCERNINMYEAIPKDKPEFNGIYDKNNKFQKVADIRMRMQGRMIADIADKHFNNFCTII